MLDIFSANPWLVAVAEVAVVTLAAIACISFNVCRRKIRVARYDHDLKRDMLQRGMSAEDIRTVIEAGRSGQPVLPPGKGRAILDPEGVHVRPTAPVPGTTR